MEADNHQFFENLNKLETFVNTAYSYLECRSSSETLTNKKIEELTKTSADQEVEIQRLQGVLTERKVGDLFEEHEGVFRTPATLQPEEEEAPHEPEDVKPKLSEINETEKFLSPVPRIHMSRKRPRMMKKAGVNILPENLEEKLAF